jgi:hypothetical protein
MDGCLSLEETLTAAWGKWDTDPDTVGFPIHYPLDTVMKAASTGQIGDDKIFVYDFGQVVRIRTGETGPDAL